MPRKNTSFADLLFEAPWWVSVMTAVITYFGMTHFLPSIQTENQLINMLLQGLAVPGPYFALFILLIAPFSFFNSRRKAKQLDTHKSIETIRQMHWRNFEELVAEAFRRQGFRVTEGGYGADGGIDLELIKNGELTLVQCKQWKSQKVGVNVIREMYGVLTASNAEKVIVICSGKFTQQAFDFAKGKPIELLSGVELLSLIQKVQSAPTVTTIEASEKVEAIETAETLEAKKAFKQAQCPKCGNTLVERIAKRGINAGNRFLGCSNFPKCRYTE